MESINILHNMTQVPSNSSKTGRPCLSKEGCELVPTSFMKALGGHDSKSAEKPTGSSKQAQDNDGCVVVLPPCDADKEDDDASLSPDDLLFETDEVGFNESRDYISMPNIERSQFNDSLVFGHISAPANIHLAWDDDLATLKGQDQLIPIRVGANCT